MKVTLILWGVLVVIGASWSIEINAAEENTEKDYYVVYANETIYENANFQIGPERSASALALEAALTYGAPFLETSLSRIHGSIFGSGRATRSTDVVIFNRSKHTFKLERYSCDSGIWTSSLLPAFDLTTCRSAAHGVESHGVFTGCTNCKVRYLATDGRTFFEVYTSNPYSGSNHGGPITYLSNLNIITVVGGGNNNMVKFQINNK